MSTRHLESLRKIARIVRLLVNERITDDVWRFTSLAAVAVVATGLLPWDETTDVIRRMAPILLFLVAITVLAELAEVAMVFDIAAREAAHLARGRTPVLFLLVAGLATLTTILLGLDTTAVLLTPVVLSLAAQLQLSPLPFAMVTVWLANTASLLLPVSNLTNLLALRRLHLSRMSSSRGCGCPPWSPSCSRSCCSGCAITATSAAPTKCPTIPESPTGGCSC